MRRLVRTLLAVAVTAAGTAVISTTPLAAQGGFTLSSPAFGNHGTIPLRNSAYGENVSPELNWTGAPEGTRSFALVLDDPDANNFVHWVIYNIPGDATSLPEGIATEASVAVPAGAVQGLTGLRRPGYFGPRPPAGAPHHYSFQLYALSSEPDLAEGLNRDALMEAIEPHIVGRAELQGMYQAQAQ